MNQKANISGMTHDTLKEWLARKLKMKPFRTGQIFTWIHMRGATTFEEMTDLSRKTRAELTDIACITVLRKTTELEAPDGTVKIVLRLDDDLSIESVLIPEQTRLTACLSTQVGCRMGCTFCRTGAAGFHRNLRADEIIAQLYHLRSITQQRISNVVLMGMGEPFDNIEHVQAALNIITDDRGICIGSRKITVSTIGLPGRIEEFANFPGQYGLALSLHSAVQKTREKLIPAAGAMPLPDLKKALVCYSKNKKRRVTLEYCLIHDVNDSITEAEALSAFAGDIPCKINLMAYNPIEGLPWKRPPDSAVKTFVEYLYPRCPAVTIRRSRGAGISGACGQLGASLPEKKCTVST